MKNQKMMGYDAKVKVESNPDTINKLIGVKTPSFSGLTAQPDRSPETKAGRDKKIDLHVNSHPYELGSDSRKDLRIEDAYAFLAGSVTEDMYSEEDETEADEAEESDSEGEDSRHSSEDGDVSSESEDNYASERTKGSVAYMATGAGLGYLASRSKVSRSGVRDRINVLKHIGKTKGLSDAQEFELKKLKGVARKEAIIGTSMGTVGNVAGASAYYLLRRKSRLRKKGENIRKATSDMNSDNFSDDEFAPGDGIVNFVHKARYAASNVGGALGGKRKFANKVDSDQRRDQTVRAAAGIVADKVGVDRETAQEVASQGTKMVAPLAKGAGKSIKKTGSKAARWVKSKM